MLRGIDARSADARRFRDLVLSLADDAGGADSLTEVDKSAIKQAAANIIECERLQADIVNGLRVDADQLVRLSNTTARLLSKLGIKRTAPKPLSLADAMAAAAETRAAREAAGADA